MKRVLTALVLIPVVLLVLFKAPMWLFTLVVGVVAIGAAWEYLQLVHSYGADTLKRVTLLLIAFLYVPLALMDAFAHESRFLEAISLATVLVVLIGGPLLMLAVVMSFEKTSAALPAASLSWMAMPYVGLTLVCLPLLRANPAGVFYILYLFVVVWSGDIFAYYVGRSFGKNKLAPRISPGKTWEGAVASLAGSAVLGTALFMYSDHIMQFLAGWGLGVKDNLYLTFIPSGRFNPASRQETLITAILLSITVNACAQVGDLVESMIKRGANVKDSGTLLPGHGGILDRIDALLFAAPIVYFYSLSYYPSIRL